MPKVVLGQQREADRELPILPVSPLPAAPQPRQMPPLPPVPGAAQAWQGARNPTAAVVQNAYIARREEELSSEADQAKRLSYEFIKAKLLTVPPWNRFGIVMKSDIKAAFEFITRSLQSADVTINIEAGSWFANENPYNTYAQMYERGIGRDGVMVLKDMGHGNGPVGRSEVDNVVSLPAQWQNAANPTQRGLRPGLQSGARIAAQMNTGALAPVNPANPEGDGYIATNARFNPRTKQVYAALNYGRRPHGSTTYYGYSYLILKNELKYRALYYPTDTFSAYLNGANVSAQIPYDRLGTVLGVASKQGALGSSGGALRSDIWRSCYEGQVLKDSSAPDKLFEAHLFCEVNFRDHVEAIVLSPKTNHADDYGHIPFSTIVANAKKFAAKHGCKLYQTS